MGTDMADIWTLDATQVVDLLRKGDITPHDILDSLEHRIKAVDPAVNALPTLCFDRAHKAADQRTTQAQNDILCGLPVAIKDSSLVSGVRSTYGSRAFEHHVPDHSDAIVHTIEHSGGIVYAKSNTPEFEAGANTFNEVFGVTKNPWNTGWSAGGSSGGAAVSVATGMAWLAQGTDFACSLRNPASFCGVVGLRPGIGMVAQGPNRAPFQTLSVAGPIARNVADCGLFLDAMCAPADIDPYARQQWPAHHFRTAASGPKKPTKIAFSTDLGITPVDPSVAAIMDTAVATLRSEGVHANQVTPPLDGTDSSFRTLRALQFATLWGHLLPEYRDVLKPDVVWNIEDGQSLSADTIITAEHDRARIRQEILSVLHSHEFLILPTSIVPPYPLEQRYVEECNGQKFSNYLEWMAIAYVITLTGCPAISVPAGMTPLGQPVGLQIVARPGCEADLLSCAAFAEQAFGHRLQNPVTP